MTAMTTAPEQPYGPGAMCDECGHFAGRHDEQGCHFPREESNPCRCAGMLWLDVRWPRPWLAAPDGLTVETPLRKWPAGSVAPADATLYELGLHMALYGSVFTVEQADDAARLEPSRETPTAEDAE